MIQFPISIDGFNEADVREEIIAPILSHLGYRTGTSANVIREQSLRYPRVFLGRKKPGSDPALRGRADYILEVDRAVRWTIEAKAPTASMTPDDIEQAYSYANHPEVRAVLFCIMNGSELRVYQTNRGPEVEPVLTVHLSDFDRGLPSIENLLSPTSIVRDHPPTSLDPGRPIGHGLRSVVRIVSGFIEFDRSEPSMPILEGLNLYIDEGAIERDENGRLIIYIKARSPFRTLNELNARLGLGRMELTTDDAVLSTDPAAPTVFRLELQTVLPAGASMPNLDGTVAVLPRNVVCRTATVAAGTLTGTTLSGSFSVTYDYRDLPQAGQSFRAKASGKFQAVLA